VEAEACFQKAIEVARSQSAKSLELRAVISLARLWQKQDKAKQAHRILAKIYSWFTEGFDTAELQEAKTLLRSWKGKQEERAKERAEQASAQRPLPRSVQEPAIALLPFLLAASSLL
jgi:predicted ATPase